MVGIEGSVVGIEGSGGSVPFGIEGILLAGFVGNVGNGVGFGKVGGVGRVGSGLEGKGGGKFGLGSGGGTDGIGGNVGLGRAGILGNAGGGAATGVSNRRRVAKIGFVESDNKAMIIDRTKKVLGKAMG
ncbi:hypothetical protein PanWU01x14_309930 [Parasponia andersonii]|uniref:Uncharacterized protein n=1 Tax=Parasponia andersonii TaxID=3476 RepID=A0A2P5AQH6_PARAD|nr:hypothetical protein PanWU01x14_309930 [Parasponia andersonii]